MTVRIGRIFYDSLQSGVFTNDEESSRRVQEPISYWAGMLVVAWALFLIVFGALYLVILTGSGLWEGR